MRLYSGSSGQFVEDTTQNIIAEKMRLAFFEYFRHYPTPNEVNSWKNSLKSMSLIIATSKLDERGILLEYQLPLSSKRLDFMICGKDDANHDNAVIVELKQWERCEMADGDNEVLTYVGGGEREVLHPAAQVGQYMMYLKDTHTAFYEGRSPMSLSACSYLHNYRYLPEDVLLLRSSNLIETCPVFTRRTSADQGISPYQGRTWGAVSIPQQGREKQVPPQQETDGACRERHQGKVRIHPA